MKTFDLGVTTTTDFKPVSMAMIPVWALPLLTNGDQSGMEQDDIDLAMAWLDGFNGGKYEALIIDETGCDHKAFSNHPAFGLPCDCVNCEVLAL